MTLNTARCSDVLLCAFVMKSLSVDCQIERRVPLISDSLLLLLQLRLVLLTVVTTQVELM